ncbi:MAG: radical SAM protein [Clostridia bacterium]|nr:radical SAM protein [Clostridia bacterium]
MHFTGTIWRPPYEADSLLLEVTAGCTHHKCKFCTLYDELPFPFRMSPLKDIEADLLEAQIDLNSCHQKQISHIFLNAWRQKQITRIFLVGANPFVLQASRLKTIADLIHSYFPSCETIGCFARITDITQKTDEELHQLHLCGYDGLTIGVETGDDDALTFMNKGYCAQDIIDQTCRLDAAGISYNFFYLTGISGAGRGNIGAIESAKVFNLTHPKRIGSSMLTVFPNSALYQEIQAGNWEEERELEKLEELRTLLAHLTIPVQFAALGASNAIYFNGRLPEERDSLLAQLDQVIQPENEKKLRYYRTTLPHL